MVRGKTHQEYATYFICSYPTFKHNSTRRREDSTDLDHLSPLSLYLTDSAITPIHFSEHRLLADIHSGFFTLNIRSRSSFTLGHFVLPFIIANSFAAMINQPAKTFLKISTANETRAKVLRT